MTGDYPNKVFRVCWVAVSPLLILVSYLKNWRFRYRSWNNYKITYYCQYCISIITFQAIGIFSIVDYKPVTYKRAVDGEYFFPDWAIALGWCITATSLLPIPLLAVYNIYQAKADGFWNVSSFYNLSLFEAVVYYLLTFLL